VWLLNDDADAAARIAEAMYQVDASGLWSRLAARAMFRFANTRWREAQRMGRADRAAAALVIQSGSRVLEEYEDDADALRQPTVIASFAVVAEAAMEVWERSGDADTGRRALSLFEKLLQVRPNNAAFLRSTALLCERLDRRDRALECWRTLVAGTSSSSEAWFEAKFHLIDLLARIDPARARAVMDQHKQLNPDYGPDPWGARLKALDLDPRLAPAGADDHPEAGDQSPAGEAGP
jgi:hypothetical protein